MICRGLCGLCGRGRNHRDETTGRSRRSGVHNLVPDRGDRNRGGRSGRVRSWPSHRVVSVIARRRRRGSVVDQSSSHRVRSSPRWRPWNRRIPQMQSPEVPGCSNQEEYARLERRRTFQTLPSDLASIRGTTRCEPRAISFLPAARGPDPGPVSETCPESATGLDHHPSDRRSPCAVSFFRD